MWRQAVTTSETISVLRTMKLGARVPSAMNVLSERIQLSCFPLCCQRHVTQHTSIFISSSKAPPTVRVRCGRQRVKRMSRRSNCVRHSGIHVCAENPSPAKHSTFVSAPDTTINYPQPQQTHDLS